jgi:hypothetical protein
MPSFEAYQGFPAVTHQERVDQLSSQGYRPISLGAQVIPAMPVTVQFRCNVLVRSA